MSETNDIKRLKEKATMLRNRIKKGWIFKSLLCEHIRLNALIRARNNASK